MFCDKVNSWLAIRVYPSGEGGTWNLMCYHARTKNAGKGNFYKVGTGPRGPAFRGANSTSISKKKFTFMHLIIQKKIRLYYFDSSVIKQDLQRNKELITLAKDCTMDSNSVAVSLSPRVQIEYTDLNYFNASIFKFFQIS